MKHFYDVHTENYFDFRFLTLESNGAIMLKSELKYPKKRIRKSGIVLVGTS